MSDPFAIVKTSSGYNPLFARIWLQGMVLRGIFYGIVFVLCCSCIRLLMSKQPRSPATPPRNKWLLPYVFFLLLSSTIVMVLGGIQRQEAYIHHLDYPGGPAAFMLADSSAIPVTHAIIFIFMQWAADGLLIWRCFTFFTAIMSSYTFLIQVFLGIIIVLDVGLSVMFVLCNAPLTLSSEAQQLRLILAYGFFNMVLNLGITMAIITKLVKHNRSVAPLLGHCSTQYHFGIISVFVESAAVLTIHNLFFIVTAATRHPLSIVGYHIWVMVQVIPPLMIIQRVARGIAWHSGYHAPDASWIKHSQREFVEQVQLPDLKSFPVSTTVEV